MDVLVVFASKHGATVDIAGHVASQLSARGHHVTVAEAHEAEVGEHGAVVVGSAVYAGHWLKPARAFVDRNRAQLVDLPVWMFSSGPLGDPPVPADDPVDVALVELQIGAREHRTFTGRLDHDELGLAERAMVRAVHAPYGDFRDWDAVRAWADEIADALDRTCGLTARQVAGGRSVGRALSRSTRDPGG